MSNDVFPWPEPTPGPIACPPWRTRQHDSRDGNYDNVVDGIIHISEAVIWDVLLNRPFPVRQFDLVS